MEINSFLSSHLQAHYKKLLIICTATVSIYLIKKYIDKRRRAEKKAKKKIREFPTIEEIQKFFEDMPFDAVTSEKSVTLKDLLGELSEFSEDEDWKELMASVHNMYRDSKASNKENLEDTGSIMSIYEDPNVISLNGTTPRDEHALNTEKSEEQANENKGNGDGEISNNSGIGEKKEDNDIDALNKNVGEGDIKESI